MTEPPQPSYQNYPAPEPTLTPGPGASDWVVIYTVFSDSPHEKTSVGLSEPMTEAQALATVESIARRGENASLSVDDTCDVVQIGPRDVLVRRRGPVYTVTTRVDIGRRPPS